MSGMPLWTEAGTDMMAATTSAAISARPANLAFGVVMGFLPAEVAPSVPQIVLSTNHTRAGVPDCEDAVYDPALLGRRFRLPTNVRLWL